MKKNKNHDVIGIRFKKNHKNVHLITSWLLHYDELYRYHIILCIPILYCIVRVMTNRMRKYAFKRVLTELQLYGTTRFWPPQPLISPCVARRTLLIRFGFEFITFRRSINGNTTSSKSRDGRQKQGQIIYCIIIGGGLYRILPTIYFEWSRLHNYNDKKLV